MTQAELHLPEFDLEIAATRAMLERVPGDRFGWRPHEKSWTLGELATHLANLPSWAVRTFDTDELDLAPPEGGPLPRMEALETPEAVIDFLDRNTGEARSTLEDAPEAAWSELWTLRMGDTEVFTLPRSAVYRQNVLNHLIHHRGQLTVYLRLLDVSVPATYGPTADEG